MTTAGAAPADGSGQVTLRLEAPAEFTLYPADEGAEARNTDFVVPVSVVRSDGGDARGVTVTVNVSGLGGVARAEPGGGGNCGRKGAVFTCRYGDVQNGDGESNNPFVLTGAAGVSPGDSGTVTYTATADNAAPVTGTTRMTVGGPTLLTPGEEKPLTGVEPGKPAESASVTPRFANHSRFTPANGVGLRLSSQDGVIIAGRPENCLFNPAYTEAWCTFTTRPAPGTAYRTSSPVGITAAPGTLAATLAYTWSSDVGGPGEPSSKGLTVRGTDAPLTLAATPDQGFTGATGSVPVETTVQADHEPIAAPVRGRVGDTVTVRLGARNNGPGQNGGMDEQGRFEVVPPEGTTVTSIPYSIEGDPGDWACERPAAKGGAFVCELDKARSMDGQRDAGSVTLGFRVRIDRQVPGARGTIRTYHPYDRTPGNDTASFPLEASPAPFHRTAPFRWGVGGAGAAVVLAALAYRYRRRLSGTSAAGTGGTTTP
ncbi:hypothetical protein AB0O07_13335 [Streptomyces sp. NPDC093085]|uniref:hypothetical protein n=1 Tax=Streptomyces sp. NPDC093085 TaxID=3155068 RepID=UPI003413812C